jgi:hypothetical protein
MKATKHTPGPWEVQQGFSGPLGGPQETPYISIVKDYGEESGDVIADVCRQAEHTEANARLLAAAPELLEVLIALRLAVDMGEARLPAALGIRISNAVSKAG